MEEIMKEIAQEVEEYEASLEETEQAETTVDANAIRVARIRNSRRRAAQKNADFEVKKASKKEAKIEKNSDSHGHCPMKSRQVAYFKTARRRAMRRKANKLVSAEQE